MKTKLFIDMCKHRYSKLKTRKFEIDNTECPAFLSCGKAKENAPLPLCLPYAPSTPHCQEMAIVTKWFNFHM